MDRLAASRPYVIIVLVGLVVCLPLLIFGLPYGSHDGVSHSIHLRGFSDQLWAGEIYPRWLISINGGLGGPVFFYYQPAAYYFSSFFYLLTASTWHQLGIAAAASVILSGAAAYAWLKERVPAGPAVLYMVLPYHLHYDVYIRGALAEAFSFVAMPLVLLAVERMIVGSKIAIVGLAFSIALLLTTHLLTSMMFLTIPFAYLLYVSPPGTRIQNFIRAFLGALLGTGLAALTYQNYAHFERFTEGGFYFGGLLIGAGPPADKSWKHVMFLLFNLAFLLPGIFLYRRAASGESKRILGFWIAALSLAIFMTLFISYPVWLLIRPLQMIQFPWRFNVIACLAALTIFLNFHHLFARIRANLIIASLTALAFCTVVWTDESGRKTWLTFIKLPLAPVSMELEYDQDKMQRADPTLWPRTVPDGRYEQASDLDQNLAPLRSADGEMIRARGTAEGASVQVLKWRPRDISLRIVSPSETDVTVSQLYFPGWRADIPQTNQTLEVFPEPDMGLIRFRAPAGDEQVELKLDKLWQERAGDLISIISFFLSLAIGAFFLWSKNGKYHQKPEAVTTG
jgi:hypothetical protein